MVLSSLGILSIRRTATQYVVGLALAVGLHLTARLWRKLAGKCEQGIRRVMNGEWRGRKGMLNLTMHLPCWALYTSRKFKSYSITVVDAKMWQSNLEVEGLFWRALDRYGWKSRGG